MGNTMKYINERAVYLDPNIPWTRLEWEIRVYRESLLPLNIVLLIFVVVGGILAIFSGLFQTLLPLALLSMVIPVILWMFSKNLFLTQLYFWGTLIYTLAYILFAIVGVLIISIGCPTSSILTICSFAVEIGIYVTVVVLSTFVIIIYGLLVASRTRSMRQNYMKISKLKRENVYPYSTRWILGDINRRGKGGGKINKIGTVLVRKDNHSVVAGTSTHRF